MSSTNRNSGPLSYDPFVNTEKKSVQNLSGLISYMRTHFFNSVRMSQPYSILFFSLTASEYIQALVHLRFSNKRVFSVSMQKLA